MAIPSINPNSVPVPEPDPVVDELTVAGMSPHMLARVLMGIILFGVLVSAIYIVARRSDGTEGPPKPLPVVAAEPAIPVPAETLAAAPPLPPRPQVRVPTPALPAMTPEELAGKTFLQVGAIERTMISQYIDDLAGKGFTARVAEGPEPGIVRILVGPLSGPELSQAEAKLTAAGIASFPKTY